MPLRVALLTLLLAVSACDSRPRDSAPVRPPAPEPPAVVLSAQQIFERAEQCANTSRDEFRRAWHEGSVDSADGQLIADFASHYNARLDTCFYLLTVNYPPNENVQGSAPAGTLRKMLVAINEREVYGEYLGPATTESPPAVSPKNCRVTSFYCASEREWEVLVGAFMED